MAPAFSTISNACRSILVRAMPRFYIQEAVERRHKVPNCMTNSFVLIVLSSAPLPTILSMY